MTAWQEQQTAMLGSISSQHATPAKREFLAIRAKALAAVAGERKTKRQALDAMRKKYEQLRAAYLRLTGTTYEGWLEHGPAREWDEVLAHAADDAAWDRLIDRCVEKERTRG